MWVWIKKKHLSSVETEKGAIVILHFHLAWSLFSSGEQRVQEHGLSLRQDWVIPPGGRGGVFRLPQTLNTKGWLERMAAMVFSGRSWTKSSYIIRQVVISNATKVSFCFFSTCFYVLIERMEWLVLLLEMEVLRQKDQYIMLCRHQRVPS